MSAGLYSVTVVKVFVFDLSHLAMMHRIISSVVLGVLLPFASLL